MGSAIATAVAYRIAHLGGLIFGRIITPSRQTMSQLTDHHRSNDRQLYDYHPAPGVYDARQLVKGVSPLLQSVVLGLGHGGADETPAHETLIEGLAASLATTGRESTLPLSYGTSDTSRKEIAAQAQRVGRSLVKYASEAFNLDSADPTNRIRSPCEGHLWTSDVASLLLGPRSHHLLMELYNEWLHRMILLRDILLPFENYDEVPLLITASMTRGLRECEDARKIFLLKLLTGIIPHTAIVDLAKIFTAPDLPRGGYGFQYSQGLILPAFLSGSASTHLLRHHPARLEDSRSDLLFDYEHQDYYSALCNEVSEAEYVIPPGIWPPLSLFAVNTQLTQSSLGVNIGSDSSRRILKLEIRINNDTSTSVDIGQISRGKRYAYNASSRDSPDSDSGNIEEPLSQDGNGSPKLNGTKASTIWNPQPMDMLVSSEATSDPAWQGLSRALLHRTATILSQPGLVTTSKSHSSNRSTDEKNQIHIVPASSPVIKLALLGKLYPGNVILLKENEAPENARKTGKGFGGRFVILECGEKDPATRIDRNQPVGNNPQLAS